LRNGRPLSEILAQSGARFLASDSKCRTVDPPSYLHDPGRDLVAELRDIHASPRDARRPVLMATGIYGSAKTELLQRALDAIPPAGPTLDVARVFITFDYDTQDALEPGGRDRFNAALLLRVFHAALTTLGPKLDFYHFLRNAHWEQFIDAATYLTPLADALGVQTLAVAVDKITNGVRDHMPTRADLETQTVTQLCDLFRWADIKREHLAAAPRGADDEATTAAVVIPILSCLYPRHARAAQRSDSDRTLLWLQADLAPCVSGRVHRVDPSSRPAVAARLLELSNRQQYAACGGHVLCAKVCAEVAEVPTSPDEEWDWLKACASIMTRDLSLKSCGRGLATMMAQAVSGMTFSELQKRHGDAAAPLDPFFPSESSVANLPLAVALSPNVFGQRSSLLDLEASPLIEAFRLWRKAATDALQQPNEEGMRKQFEQVVARGLVLRWAAFLAPTPPTPTQPAPPAPPPSVAFCAGRGAYLDPDGSLCWIELSDVAVCEPFTYVHGEVRTFPPPGGIPRSTPALVSAAATNPAVVSGGCVTVSSLPRPFEGFRHVYFTVRSHRSASPDAGGLGRLMPTDAPCLHVFWTPRSYTPEPSALEALLRKLRSSRGGAAAIGPCFDVVAFVNVQDCLTPSLAWTLTCADF
jgi:hypothetical protein